MKKQLGLFVIAALSVLMPFNTFGIVTATVVEEEITPSIPDMDDDGRVYASVSYTINVKGANGHTLRIEIPWLDALGKPTYFNIDEGEQAVSTETYTADSDDYNIEGWVGTYHDAFWLKPGSHKLNGTIRIFDETAGKYIKLEGAKKHLLTIESQKKAPGIVVTNQYIEHNQYHNNAKGMHVRYEFEANWMKGREIRWEVRLYKANGTPIPLASGGVEKVTSNGTCTYTFCKWSDLGAHFPYSGMKLPRGKTNCYAIIKFFDAKTGKPIPAKGANKMEFNFSK